MSRYSSQTSKSTSLLKDGSWIKKMDDEDEAVDQDPNFGKTVLGRYRSNEALDSSEAEDTKTTKSMSTSTSVQALTKRFSGSQDELRSSTLPPSKTTSSYTKSTYSTLKSDSPKTTTTSKTTVTEEPKKGTTTTTVIKDGKTTTETIITTTESVRSPVLKSPTKTETFTERVLKSSNKGLSPTFSPTRTTKVTETTVTSNKDAEDQLYDKLLPSSIKDNFSPMDSTTVSSTKTTTVKSSGNGDGIKTTTTTRTSSLAEDDLYGTLLPKSMTSNLPSPVSDDYSSDRNSYLYTRPDSSGVTSSSVYNIYRSRSRSDDSLGDPIYSKSSVTSVYASPERTVLEKDLCTICRKPFIGDAKMVLDEMKINCHASCFKCEVCNNTLGHMKAGDSMWIYKRMVHCENCFEVTREKWRR